MTATPSSTSADAPASPVDDERITAVGLLLEAAAGLVAVLDRDLRSRGGLPLSSFEVLLRLSRSPGRRLRMASLADQVALSPSGLSRLIDRLEAGGLVDREECPSDRRGLYAVLTDAGWARTLDLLPDHLEAVEQRFTGQLDPDELAALTTALRKVRDPLCPSPSDDG